MDDLIASTDENTITLIRMLLRITPLIMQNEFIWKIIEFYHKSQLKSIDVLEYTPLFYKIAQKTVPLSDEQKNVFEKIVDQLFFNQDYPALNNYIMFNQRGNFIFPLEILDEDQIISFVQEFEKNMHNEATPSETKDALAGVASLLAGIYFGEKKASVISHLINLSVPVYKSLQYAKNKLWNREEHMKKSHFDFLNVSEKEISLNKEFLFACLNNTCRKNNAPSSVQSLFSCISISDYLSREKNFILWDTNFLHVLFSMDKLYRCLLHETKNQKSSLNKFFFGDIVSKIEGSIENVGWKDKEYNGQNIKEVFVTSLHDAHVIVKSISRFFNIEIEPNIKDKNIFIEGAKIVGTTALSVTGASLLNKSAWVKKLFEACYIPLPMYYTQWTKLFLNGLGDTVRYVSSEFFMDMLKRFRPISPLSMSNRAIGILKNPTRNIVIPENEFIDAAPSPEMELLVDAYHSIVNRNNTNILKAAAKVGAGNAAIYGVYRLLENIHQSPLLTQFSNLTSLSPFIPKGTQDILTTSGYDLMNKLGTTLAKKVHIRPIKATLITEKDLPDSPCIHKESFADMANIGVALEYGLLVKEMIENAQSSILRKTSGIVRLGLNFATGNTGGMLDQALSFFGSGSSKVFKTLNKFDTMKEQALEKLDLLSYVNKK